jgi:hypothetical protein
VRIVAGGDGSRAWNSGDVTLFRKSVKEQEIAGRFLAERRGGERVCAGMSVHIIASIIAPIIIRIIACIIVYIIV